MVCCSSRIILLHYVLFDGVHYMQDLFLFIQRHWQLNVILLIILLLLILIEFMRLKRRAAEISPTHLIQQMNHDHAVVIDIRSTADFQTGHIIDAHSYPLSSLTDPASTLNKFKTKPLAIVCYAGISSQKVTASLKKAGYNACSLKGGMRAWKEADMPIVKEGN